ncbi:hypothetical protein [Noviherbaspirillum sp.]|uniref:hypothetical protein n=1 Tax=Noviherbaspirillum sp. TaxID=1926288 RepID=UPI002FE3C419
MRIVKGAPAESEDSTVSGKWDGQELNTTAIDERWLTEDTCRRTRAYGAVSNVVSIRGAAGCKSSVSNDLPKAHITKNGLFMLSLFYCNMLNFGSVLS